VAQAVGAKLDAGMGVLLGHLVFLAVLLFKPNGLFSRGR
jgi:branched-chain amino acid transport system permease protein